MFTLYKGEIARTVGRCGARRSTRGTRSLTAANFLSLAWRRSRTDESESAASPRALALAAPSGVLHRPPNTQHHAACNSPSSILTLYT
ncbi:jg16393 [Pararge aegeria aegeria]|uniref:Jg16393 protein n=1 Tax=Pararge aegeria aegeria TaxID=348720 RepID=A0A8S4SET2_9NEOP|nr:jg16393 [Pararge aegeria aegeria]